MLWSDLVNRACWLTALFTGRGLVYGLLTAILIPVYLVVVAVLTPLLRLVFGAEAIGWASLTSTVVVVWLALVLRDSAQRTVNGLFSKSKVDPQTQLAVLNEIGRAITSTSSLDDLLAAVYGQIGRLMEVDNFYVALYDDEADELCFPLVRQAGQPCQWPNRRLGDGPAEFVIRRQQPLFLPGNVSTLLSELGIAPPHPTPKSWLGVPMRLGQKVIGVMAVMSYEREHAYHPDHLSVLSTVAAQMALAIENARLHAHTDQALAHRVQELSTQHLSAHVAIAIENAHLYQESERRVGELMALQQVSLGLTPLLDLEAVLNFMAESILQLVGADEVCIFLYEEDSGDFRFGACLTGAGQRGTRLVPPCRETELMATVARSGEALVINDAKQHPLYQKDGDGPGEVPETIAGFPLKIAGRVVGVFDVVFTHPHTFTDDKLRTLTLFAAQAAVAIESARLYRESQQRLREQSLLSAAGASIASTLDLDHVLREVAEQLAEAVEVNTCVLSDWNQEAGTLTTVAEFAALPHLYEVQMSIPVEDYPAMAGVLRTGRPLVVSVDDPQADEAERARLATWGVGTMLRLAVRAAGGIVGVTEVFNLDVGRRFTTAEMEQGQAVADRMGTIIEKAGQEPQRAGVALRIEIERMISELGVEWCKVSRWDEEQGTLNVVAEYGGLTWLDRMGTVYDLGDYLASEKVLRTRRPLIVRASDPHADRHERALLQKWGPGTLLALPMIARDQVVGLAELMDRRERRFSKEEITLCQTLANQAAIAIENARLFQKVAEGRDKLEAILNSSHEGILMLDTLGRVVMVNAVIEEWSGLDRGRLLGHDLATLVTETPNEMLRCLSCALAELEKLWQKGREDSVVRSSYELPGLRPRFIEQMLAPVLDETGSRIGQVAVLHDITERKELERMREDLIHMLVHDLRGPLGGIIGGLNMLKMIIAEEVDSPHVNEMLEVAYRSSENMLDMVNSLLDISRFEAGKMPLDLVPVDFFELVQDVVEQIHPMAAESNIALRIAFPPDLPPVVVDRDIILRVVFNLFDNAIKFTPRGGTVRITTGGLEAAGVGGRPYLSVSVSDTGPGILAKYQDKIFDKFGQVEITGGRRQKGTGLGLTFCKLAVEAHGGHIWVDSEPDQGSVFTFTLPVAEESGA